MMANYFAGGDEYEPFHDTYSPGKRKHPVRALKALMALTNLTWDLYPVMGPEVLFKITPPGLESEESWWLV